MINFQVFCPFGRVSDIFIALARKAKFDVLEIQFDGFVRAYSVFEVAKFKTDNVQPIATLADRASFCSRDEVTGVVTFTRNGAVPVTVRRVFRVLNCLSTDSPGLVSDELYNGRFGETSLKVFYPEAKDVENHLRLTPAKKNVSGVVRPFFNYILKEKRDEEYIILGPKSMEFQSSYWKVKVKDVEYSLFAEGLGEAIVPMDETIPNDDIIEITDTWKITLRLHGHDSNEWTEPFRFYQNACAVYGGRIDYRAQLNILKIACLVEYIKTHKVRIDLPSFVVDDHVVIDMNLTNNVWYLTPELEKFCQQHVYSNQLIADLFKRIYATEDGIYFSFGDDHLPGTISNTRPSSACFALSFARYLSMVHRGSVLDFVTAWVSLVNSDWLQVEKSRNGYMIFVGTTYGKANHPLSIIDADGVFRQMHFTRNKDYSSPNLDQDGYVILGYDANISQNNPDEKPNGVPAHYILAYVKNHRLYAVFDSYRDERWVPEGRDITNLLSSSDAIFVSLKCEDEIIPNWWCNE